jgi:hypothetical protein
MGRDTATQALKEFHWERQPAASRLVDTLLKHFLHACAPAAEFAKRMRHDTATRFRDWVDFIEVPKSLATKSQLTEVGFTAVSLPGADRAFVHHGAIFPTVVIGSTLRVGIKVDSVADFVAANRLEFAEIIGEPLSQLRLARTFRGAGADLWAVERHGFLGLEPPAFDAARAIASVRHLEGFRHRRRDWPDDEQGYAEAHRLVDAAVGELVADWACDLFFEAERRFWQGRNRAAHVQKARQDKLGLGWANHDHHTYRCARENFKAHVALLEKLGLKCRERFYAGAEAGWGAQVMEQPVTGVTTFNDVDMSPEELLGDFAHEGFHKEATGLGTVGLWCALHGEAMLQAGMHHLECQFDWKELVDQLEREAHIRTMAPFTTFPYLRQAFTEGERWSVRPERIERLLSKGLITKAQAETFRTEGAIGSHLENLERNEGFKGFNQQGVSEIIARTDPRKQHQLSGA